MERNAPAPMLFPYEPEQFWNEIRQIIKEEVSHLGKSKRNVETTFETPGLTYKPLYKIAEVCEIFQVTKPTIYEWIKKGKLIRYKIESRTYFLWNDIQKLISATDEC